MPQESQTSTIYAAPMQGYTDRPFRRAHALTIGGIQEYVTPFARLEKEDFRKRDLKDLQPDLDLTATTVPQILVRTPQETRKLAELIRCRGFRRMDLNAGCPFPKVTGAGYGAAILQRPRELEAVLKEAARFTPSLELSIKLRLPTPADDTHLQELADILNDCPLCHVTLHPRCLARTEQTTPDMDAFQKFRKRLAHTLVYNGDITAPDSPRPPGDIMIGRGILQNPLLPLELRGMRFTPQQRRERILAYHKALVTETGACEQQPLQKIRTLWDYFLPNMTGRLRKKVIKAKSLEDYMTAAHELIAEIQ